MRPRKQLVNIMMLYQHLGYDLVQSRTRIRERVAVVKTE
jgi:hypothetical protein